MQTIQTDVPLFRFTDRGSNFANPLYNNMHNVYNMQLDMCLWHGGNKVQIWQNIYVPNFYPAQPLVKCEKPLEKLTVQVWLLYDHPNFKYCTLCISGTELWKDGQTDKRTDGRTDDPNTRCPRWTFQAGDIKRICYSILQNNQQIIL